MSASPFLFAEYYYNNNTKLIEDDFDESDIYN